MGDVWLAIDLELERPVALKLLAPDADHVRFEREARAAAALNHPNVTQLYDYGEVGGHPYMALEYLSGGTLEDRLSAGKPLQDDEAAAIAAQLAAGLAHAHAHGLVHRDLKPGNVLFDDEGRPKIADFGIARSGTGSTITEEGTVLGTAGYISPEQAAGKPATTASDVYSFGVILFRMLTGRLPFEADSPLELVEMHRRLDAPPVESLRQNPPAHLAVVAEASLARDPQGRPADGAALEAALDVPGATLPTGGPSSAPTLILPPEPHRRTRLAVALAALGLAAAAGTAGAFLLTRDQSHRSNPTIPLPTSAPATSTSATTATASTVSTTAPPPTVTAPPTTTTLPPTTTVLPPTNPPTTAPTATSPNP
jgi:serine/threonine-protein kinase